MSLIKRTGIVTVVVVVLAITTVLVYNYAYLVYQDYDYHTSYKDVHGLQRSSPVFLNGVRIGEVTKIKLNKELHHVDVVLSVKKEVPIPKGSIALIASNNLVDTRMIYIRTTDNPEILKHNDKIIGKYDTTVLEMQDQIAPIIDGAKYILNTAEKNFNNFNRKLDQGLVEKTQTDIRTMERDMSSYRKQVASIEESANKVVKSLSSLKAATYSIKQKKDTINSSIENAVEQTNTIASVKIADKTTELKQNLDSVNQQISTTTQNPTLQKYLNDNALYKSTTESVHDANESMKELKEAPPGISLIGN